MPRVEKVVIKKISVKGSPRHCVMVHLDKSLGKGRRGGKLAPTMAQGCFGTLAKAKARAAQYPKGRSVK